VSEIGKEVTIGILNKGDFFGEACLTGQPLRLCSATAMTDCSVMKIEEKSMNEVLNRQHAFSDMFVG
jgi:CRP-like cAMP-binding protein